MTNKTQHNDSARWDQYFLSVCRAVSTKSQCLSRQLGALLVQDKSIVATGYNGPPRGVPHCNTKARREDIVEQFEQMDLYEEEIVDLLLSRLDVCPRRLMGYKSGLGLEWCMAAHAEKNCLINAARLGVRVQPSILYLSGPMPCKDCMIALINAGVTEVVVETVEMYNDSRFLLDHCDIRIRPFREVRNE